MKVPVTEIFFSYQGEGLFVGEPQIFLRFCGCNLFCDYCDTPAARCVKTGTYKLLSVKEIKYKIDKLYKKHKKAFDSCFKKGVVAVTGGEPLLYTDILKVLLPLLKKKYIIYLETNGTLPGAYNKIKKYVDIVSMDVKYPSACRKHYWQEHEDFIKSAKKNVFVKAVMTNKTKYSEIKKSVDMIKKVSLNISLVLQPVSKLGTVSAPGKAKLKKWHLYCKRHLKNTFVIPQMHKVWNIK